MKKIALILMIVFAGIFVAGCVMDHVFYCPYCSSVNIKKVSDNVFKCENSNCGKEFAAIIK
jgi:ribosomal protein L37AE/L43A